MEMISDLFRIKIFEINWKYSELGLEGGSISRPNQQAGFSFPAYFKWSLSYCWTSYSKFSEKNIA
jgi:hypothetical protein